MNRYASLSLSIASVFFLVMAILVNSPPLFYMVTAVLATLGAAAVQAYLDEEARTTRSRGSTRLSRWKTAPWQMFRGRPPLRALPWRHGD